MEQFPAGANENNETSAPLDNPFFFERKEQNEDVESYVEKRSLSRVAKYRNEGESYEDYKKRMEASLNYILGSLPKAADSLKKFQEENKEKEQGGRNKVNAELLLPVVDLQNRIVSVLADLDPEDRFKYIWASREALNTWFEKARVDDKDVRSEMRTLFDGCEAVCGYMDRRKQELGDKTEFFTDVFLDWKYGIDLLEFDRRDDEKLDMRLVQNKSSFGSDADLAAKVTAGQDRHASWVENELMGTHDILDRLVEVIQVEYGSTHQEDLRSALADSFADSALTALDVVGEAGEYEGEADTNPIGPRLKNESMLSRLAFAYAFHGDENEDLRRLAEKAGQDTDNLMSHMPIARIYSVFAVHNEEPVPPVRLYSAARDEKDISVGTEPSV